MNFQEALAAKIATVRALREAARLRSAEALNAASRGLRPYAEALSEAATEIKRSDQGRFLFGTTGVKVEQQHPGIFAISHGFGTEFVRVLSVVDAGATFEHCLFDVEASRSPDNADCVELRTTFYVNVNVDEHFELDETFPSEGNYVFMDRAPVIQTVASPEQAVQALFETATNFLALNEHWITQMIKEDKLARGVAGSYRR